MEFKQSSASEDENSDYKRKPFKENSISSSPEKDHDRIVTGSNMDLPDSSKGLHFKVYMNSFESPSRKFKDFITLRSCLLRSFPAIFIPRILTLELTSVRLLVINHC